MQKKTILSVLVDIILVGIILIASAKASTRIQIPQFEDYPVAIYTQRIHVPAYYVQHGDVWRDNMGKQVEAPRINFAGKYYIGLHSCGAECRYFTLSDLKENRDSPALDMFSSAGQDPMKTSDGRVYTTELISRPDSKLLVARFHIEKASGAPDECRQRIFVLSNDGQKVEPVTNTINSCSSR
jgi:hypothetical protein